MVEEGGRKGSQRKDVEEGVVIKIQSTRRTNDVPFQN